MTVGSDTEGAVVEVSPRNQNMMLIDGDGRGQQLNEEDGVAAERTRNELFCQT